MKTFLNNLNSKYVYGVLFLLAMLMLIDWFVFSRTPVDELKQVTSAVSERIQKTKEISNDEIVSGTAIEGTQYESTIIDPRKINSTELRNWVGREAKAMNSFNAEEEALKDHYQKIGENLSPEQFKLLSDVILNRKAILNERILSAYLIGYAGYSSIEDLARVISAEIKVDGAPVAHSLAETQMVQERAMRVLAINRLVDLAKGPDKNAANNAKDQLTKLIPTIKDATLRNYAQSKLTEI